MKLMVMVSSSRALQLNAENFWVLAFRVSKHRTLRWSKGSVSSFGAEGFIRLCRDV